MRGGCRLLSQLYLLHLHTREHDNNCFLQNARGVVISCVQVTRLSEKTRNARRRAALEEQLRALMKRSDRRESRLLSASLASLAQSAPNVPQPDTSTLVATQVLHLTGTGYRPALVGFDREALSIASANYCTTLRESELDRALLINGEFYPPLRLRPLTRHITSHLCCSEAKLTLNDVTILYRSNGRCPVRASLSASFVGTSRSRRTTRSGMSSPMRFSSYSLLFCDLFCCFLE